VSLSPGEFEYVRNLLQQQAGIALEPGKEYLVEARLNPLARQEGFPSLQQLIAGLQTSSSFASLHRKVVQAMTTNETSFFRDLRPFEVLRTHVLPELLAKAADPKLNFWCAAASTGQEPYSLAMLLREAVPLQLSTWNVRVIASDLSSEVLARALQGRYTQFEVSRGLPPRLRVKYFEQDGNEWQIRPDIRRMVEFREMNLTESWGALPPLDVIFMRNVLIYFDLDTKRSIFAKVRQVLKPGGFLFLGSSETTLNLDDGFEPVPPDRSACYRFRLQ